MGGPSNGTGTSSNGNQSGNTSSDGSAVGSSSPTSDPSAGTSSGEKISVPGDLIAFQEQLLGFAVTELGINGDGNVDSISIWSQSTMNFGDISVVPNNSNGVTIGLGYDSSDAGSGMFIGMYGGVAKMDQ